MVVVNGVEVRVQMGSVGTEEHVDQHVAQTPTPQPRCHHFVERYIEVNAGERFSVHYGSRKDDALAGALGLKFKIYLDGIKVRTRSHGSLDEKSYIDGLIEGQNGCYHKRFFYFDQLKEMSKHFVTPSVEEEYMQKMANVGTIEVKVYRAKSVHTSKDTFLPNEFPTFSHDGVAIASRSGVAPAKVLAEKSSNLKCNLRPAVDYKYSPKQSGTQITRTKLTLRDSEDVVDDCPFIIFRLYYRSREDLEYLLDIRRPADGLGGKATTTGCPATIKTEIKTEEPVDFGVVIKPEPGIANDIHVKTEADDGAMSTDNNEDDEVQEIFARSVDAVRKPDSFVDLTGVDD